MLDQFFTRPEVAVECVRRVQAFMPTPALVVEPSAGTGAFLTPLRGAFGQVLAYDLEPQADGIEQSDFLTVAVPKGATFVGNPPFGKRAKLSVAFFNHCATQGAAVIAFIVPVQWRKWSVHRQLAPGYALFRDYDLPERAFVNVKGVRCCFQIWVSTELYSGSDLRIRQAPAISHPDFTLVIYNCYPHKRHYFTTYDWDVAIPRQGHADYTRREIIPARCEFTTHWILIKASTPAVLERLMAIDYAALSRKSTKQPGYGKADLIQAYEALT